MCTILSTISHLFPDPCFLLKKKHHFESCAKPDQFCSEAVVSAPRVKLKLWAFVIRGLPVPEEA